MTVKDIMKKDVATCTSNDDVATAVKIMYEHKCGFVPVIDSRGSATQGGTVPVAPAPPEPSGSANQRLRFQTIEPRGEWRLMR